MAHSKNFYKVEYYYDNGLWTEEMVRNASKNPPGNPWITEEEADEIINIDLTLVMRYNYQKQKG